MKPRPAAARMAMPMSMDALTMITEEQLGQDVAEDDPAPLGSDRPGRLDEAFLAHGQGSALDQPDVARPPDHRQGDHAIDHARTHRPDHRQGEDPSGDGQKHVSDPHDRLADPAAEVAGGDAQGGRRSPWPPG